MITSFDDYPIHQTWQPIAHTESGDPGHYDRYFFNGYTRDGSLFFALAMGLYPNRHVMDAAFSVVINGEQINLRASARAHNDRLKCTTVGPISVEIVEPLVKHRVTLSSPEHGITGSIQFTASSLPYEEAPFLTMSGNRKTMHYTRLTQLGSWSGNLEVDGQRINISSSDCVGSRDRSWGIRNVGERVQLGAPVHAVPQFYWLWAPVCFDTFGTVFDVNEYADGERWHQSGARLVGRDTIQHAHSVTYDFGWEQGTRRAENFSLTYEFAHTSMQLSFTPLLHFQMSGLGYLHPEWGHGFWKGELEVTSDRFTLPVPDPLAPHFLHVQTLSNVSCVMSDGSTHQGIGVLETLVIGQHEPSGFQGMIDGYAPR
ncbi:MAG: hypothetical protein ACO3JF_08845 [Ilumatobacteraceae bacterium]